MSPIAIALWVFVACLWAFIIWLQIVLCKKIVWLKYDLGRNRYRPSNRDWLDQIHENGGPLIVLPIIDVFLIFITICEYISLRSNIGDCFWENKPLKR